MLQRCWVTFVTKMDGKVYITALLSDEFVPFMYDIYKKQWEPMPRLQRHYFVLVAVHSKNPLEGP